MFARTDRTADAARLRSTRGGVRRLALMGSTALVGVALAAPANAQSINPTGGGTISGTGTYSDSTATGGGVVVSNTYNSGITLSGVTIANTTGSPTADAYNQNAAFGESAVLIMAARGRSPMPISSPR